MPTVLDRCGRTSLALVCALIASAAFAAGGARATIVPATTIDGPSADDRRFRRCDDGRRRHRRRCLPEEGRRRHARVRLASGRRALERPDPRRRRTEVRRELAADRRGRRRRADRDLGDAVRYRKRETRRRDARGRVAAGVQRLRQTAGHRPGRWHRRRPLTGSRRQFVGFRRHRLQDRPGRGDDGDDAAAGRCRGVDQGGSAARRTLAVPRRPEPPPGLRAAPAEHRKRAADRDQLARKRARRLAGAGSQRTRRDLGAAHLQGTRRICDAGLDDDFRWSGNHQRRRRHLARLHPSGPGHGRLPPAARRYGDSRAPRVHRHAAGR